MFGLAGAMSKKVLGLFGVRVARLLMIITSGHVVGQMNGRNDWSPTIFGNDGISAVLEWSGV